MAKSNRDLQNQPQPPPVADYYYDQFQPVPQVVGEDVARSLDRIGESPGAIADKLDRLGDQPPGAAAKKNEPYPDGKGSKK
jgi:hypothetical protein